MRLNTQHYKCPQRLGDFLPAENSKGVSLATKRIARTHAKRTAKRTACSVETAGRLPWGQVHRGPLRCLGCQGPGSGQECVCVLTDQYESRLRKLRRGVTGLCGREWMERAEAASGSESPGEKSLAQAGGRAGPWGESGDGLQSVRARVVRTGQSARTGRRTLAPRAVSGGNPHCRTSRPSRTGSACASVRGPGPRWQEGGRWGSGQS